MLMGRAGDPIAEGHLVIHGKGRVPLTRKLVVPNILPKKAIEYKVLSDLECVSGKDGIKVDAGNSGNYQLTILPSQAGVLHGSVSFQAETGPLPHLNFPFQLALPS